MLNLSRIVWLVTGATWAARSLLERADPDYWDPVTTLDWSAVWTFTAALLLLATSALLIARLAPSRWVTSTATIVAIGAVTAGLANAIEDGFGVKAAGLLYVAGFLTGWLGLLLLAPAFAHAKLPRLAGLCVVLFLGVMLFTVGGGLVILVALGSIAVAPAWYLVPRREKGNADPESVVGNEWGLNRRCARSPGARSVPLQDRARRACSKPHWERLAPLAPDPPVNAAS